MKNFGALILVAIILLANALSITACDWCRIKVRKSLYAEDFISNLLLMLLPVAILSAVGIAVYFKDEIAKRISEKSKK